MQIFSFGRNNRFIFNIIEAVLFRPKLYLVLEYQLSADDFSVSNTTQGDTPSSFALGCVGNAEIVRAQLILKAKT